MNISQHGIFPYSGQIRLKLLNESRSHGSRGIGERERERVRGGVMAVASMASRPSKFETPRGNESLHDDDQMGSIIKKRQQTIRESID